MISKDESRAMADAAIVVMKTAEASAWRNRAEKAEAERDRLRDALQRIVGGWWTNFPVDSEAANVAAQIIDEMQQLAREALASLTEADGGGE